MPAAARTAKLTDAQKAQLAELDARYTAKIAEREIALRDGMNRAAAGSDAATREQLEQQLVRERKALLAELEEKKDAVRRAKG